jgi:cytochrome P450
VTTVAQDETADFFTDPSLSVDPYPWYEQMRSHGPVWREPHHGVVMISGLREATQVLSDADNWSSCLSVTGPFPGLPERPTGEHDVRQIIDAARPGLPMSEHLVAMDPPDHTRHRALLMRLLTPRRLKQSEDFVRDLGQRQIGPLIERGHAELLKEFASNFALLVVADLLGVPPEDHAKFRQHLGALQPGEVNAAGETVLDPLSFLAEYFSRYVEDRRANPRGDMLTALATATFPDGSTPEVIDVVRIASFLFAAGQETSARLMVSSAHHLAEHKELQQHLRDHPEEIPAAIEEYLRLESPVKVTFRVSLHDTNIGGVDVPAGQLVAMLMGAANRDGAAMKCPETFDAQRDDLYQHIAFGRGAHACPGGALARMEAKVFLEQLLAGTSDFDLDEQHHGPPGNRNLDYDMTYILRGLSKLHLTFTPRDAA